MMELRSGGGHGLNCPHCRRAFSIRFLRKGVSPWVGYLQLFWWASRWLSTYGYIGGYNSTGLYYGLGSTTYSERGAEHSTVENDGVLMIEKERL